MFHGRIVDTKTNIGKVLSDFGQTTPQSRNGWATKELFEKEKLMFVCICFHVNLLR